MKKKCLTLTINKKNILILITIVLFIFVCATLLLMNKENKYKSNLEDNNLNKEEQTVNKNQEEVIDKIDYVVLEGDISEAAIVYVSDNFSFFDKIIEVEVNISDIIENNYIKNKIIIDMYNENKCAAYTIVKASVVEIEAKTYLNCENYKTEGYDDNHLKENSNNIENDNKTDNKTDINKTTIKIENYIGKNYIDVKSNLESLGLLVKIERKNLSSSDNKYDSKIIVDQSIKQGEILFKGDLITLYIPNVVNYYPNFCNNNYSISEIQEFADLNNLILVIEYEENLSFEPGTIFFQSRDEGTTVVEGTKLIIKVCK